MWSPFDRVCGRKRSGWKQKGDGGANEGRARGRGKCECQSSLFGWGHRAHRSRFEEIRAGQLCRDIRGEKEKPGKSNEPLRRRRGILGGGDWGHEGAGKCPKWTNVLKLLRGSKTHWGVMGMLNLWTHPLSAMWFIACSQLAQWGMADARVTHLRWCLMSRIHCIDPAFALTNFRV